MRPALPAAALAQRVATLVDPQRAPAQVPRPVTTPRRRFPVFICCDRILGACSLGGVLRTADCAGAQGAVVVPYPPHELPRGARLRPPPAPAGAAAGLPLHTLKTALGAERSVPIRAARSALPALRLARRRGWTVLAAHDAPGSTDVREFLPPPTGRGVLFVFSGELSGPDPAVIQIAHAAVRPPAAAAVGAATPLHLNALAATLLYAAAAACTDT
eukprot:TRINITY_DN33738_c0_g1_i1.p1 TRINITY_DN33738_c0_g1~~TRINITY_DN33738_c0_g1_i1.p1  ORF type:complete len:216 (+),score=36.32 TRINITY_DN33738_c0_g1_i1:100-747(+)